MDLPEPEPARVFGRRGQVLRITPRAGDAYSIAFKQRRRAGPTFIEEVADATLYPGNDGWSEVDVIWRRHA